MTFEQTINRVSKFQSPHLSAQVSFLYSLQTAEKYIKQQIQAPNLLFHRPLR